MQRENDGDGDAGTNTGVGMGVGIDTGVGISNGKVQKSEATPGSFCAATSYRSTWLRARAQKILVELS